MLRIVGGVEAASVLQEELPQFLEGCGFLTAADRALVLSIRDRWGISRDANRLELEEAAREHVNIDGELSFLLTLADIERQRAASELEQYRGRRRGELASFLAEFDAKGNPKAPPEWRVKDALDKDEDYQRLTLELGRCSSLHQYLTNLVFASARRADILVVLISQRT